MDHLDQNPLKKFASVLLFLLCVKKQQQSHTSCAYFHMLIPSSSLVPFPHPKPLKDRLSPPACHSPLCLHLETPWVLLAKIAAGKAARRIAVKFGTETDCPQTMNFNDSSDPLTFPLVASAGQSYVCEISIDCHDVLRIDSFSMIPKNVNMLSTLASPRPP